MKTTINFWTMLLCLASASSAQARMKVMTTVTDLRSLTQLVGKGNVDVESIAKGTQDPHFIDAKPSYMSKVANADLVVAIGLGLEDAWLNNVLAGGRNPKVKRGAPGFLAVGPALSPEEIPQGSEISRSQGDVHPEGNPHVTVDPIRMAKAALLIGAKLAELDPDHKSDYESNAKEVSDRLTKKSEEWKKRLEKAGFKKVVTYHKTLDYFWTRMGIELVTVLEPKPGIEPSVAHLSEVMNTMKTKGANIVLIENYFNPDVGRKLKELNANVKVAVVPVSVDGESNVKNIFELYENLVSQIEKLVK